jgi:hypothetical protein
VWNALKAPLKREQLTHAESVRHALAASRQQLKRETFPHYFQHMRDKIYPLIDAGDPLH